MTTPRQLILGAFMRPIGFHTGWWRYPGAYPDANASFAHMRSFARKLEAAKFDAFFMADHLALLNMPVDALSRSATVDSFEPLTLLSALAAVTDRLGLIATASTTYDQPYHVARRFASLDHISGGRAGWNVVTTANPDAAANFGLAGQPTHEERYDRAREFVDVVTGLWDCWSDDALLRDVASGRFVDPAKIRRLDHSGAYFNVRGPLNIARSPQGRPVVVQAGSSPAGQRLAAETAEVVFTAQATLAEAQRFYRGVKTQLVAAGRSLHSLRILPACFVVVGNTKAEAAARRAKLDSLVHWESAIASLSVALGYDMSRFDPDGFLPSIPETEQGQSARQRALGLADRERLTIRELAQRLAGYSSLAMIGTSAGIADEMERWLENDACDGFVILFSDVPGGLDAFVEKVVPELQRRGLFRREYEGATLRDHLGLIRALIPSDE